MTAAILKTGVRVLTPAEYRSLEAQITKPSIKKLVRALLLSGMRYAEILRLKGSPHDFDPERRTIYVKAGKTRTSKRERYVHLNDAGVQAIGEYLADERTAYPSSTVMGLNLQAWAKAAALSAAPTLEGAIIEAGANAGDERNNVWGLSVKSFRKSWESWLVATCPEKMALIALSQGHETETGMAHYMGISFTQAERAEIREMVQGWE